MSATARLPTPAGVAIIAPSRNFKRKEHEQKNLSTKQYQTSPHPRLPGQNEIQGGKSRHQSPSGQRPEAACRLKTFKQFCFHGADQPHRHHSPCPRPVYFLSLGSTKGYMTVAGACGAKISPLSISLTALEKTDSESASTEKNRRSGATGSKE
jgi:hypothetical protein